MGNMAGSSLGADGADEFLRELFLPRALLPGLVGVALGRYQVLFEDLGHALGERPIIDVEAGLVVEAERAQVEVGRTNRSEARRVGKECVSTGRSRWAE